MIQKEDIEKYCVGNCEKYEKCIKNIPKVCPKEFNCIVDTFELVLSEAYLKSKELQKIDNFNNASKDNFRQKFFESFGYYP